MYYFYVLVAAPPTKASQATLHETSYSEPFSISPWVTVDHRRRARTHPRPSRRDPLSIDILRGPRRLHQGLCRCATNRPEVSIIYMYKGKSVIMWKILLMCVGVCVSGLCMYVCMNACMHGWVCMYMHVWDYFFCVCEYISIYMYVYTYVYTWVYTRVYACVYM